MKLKHAITVTTATKNNVDNALSFTDTQDGVLLNRLQVFLIECQLFEQVMAVVLQQHRTRQATHLNSRITKIA